VEPAAGSERLRAAINKGITEQHVYDAIELAAGAGMRNIKLYYMIGLPGEEDEDIVETVEMIKRVRAKMDAVGNKGELVISVNGFVPKPFTPFQWEAQITPEEYLRRVHLLQANLHAKCVDYRYHESDLSRLEAVMARGDRRVGKALLEAHNLGCRLDGWDEYFDYEKWLEAFRRAGVRDVELKLYKGLRHEILNEDCRAVVYNDLWSWIEKHL